MLEEDKKLQKQLVDEMMKVYKTNPDVIIYMDSLMKKYEELQEEIERLKTNLEVANEDLTRIAQLLNLEEGCTIYDIEDKIERLNNIINELERYINEEYIYDELGMKIFDASKLQDKLQELKGSDKE